MGFRSAWMQGALERAAFVAGYADWWPAEELSRSVASYLQQHYDRPTVNLETLQRAVREALAGVGYDEVAKGFTLELISLS